MLSPFKSPPPLTDDTRNDVTFASLLSDVEGEEAPERLLQLARQLQDKVDLRNQHDNPH